MRVSRYLLTIIAILFIASSCSNQSKDMVPAIILDYNEIAGCGYVLQLEDRTMLEPINLHEFDPNPEDGKRVLVEYYVVKDLNSICNAGKIVEIISYREGGTD